jgi:O-antigen/teichoic acid export membrane protein
MNWNKKQESSPSERDVFIEDQRTALPLTAKVVKGASWVFAGRAAGRVFELIKAVVLARLLTPEDFGLFGIVMLAIITLEIFSQSGFNTALIQRQGDIQGYLDTAWTVQVARGLLLALILFMVAPGVAWFFEEPRVVELLQIICLAQILQGFINIGIVLFEKEMQFHKQFLYEVGANVVSLIIGVSLAFALRSVWALIWANVAGVSMRLVLSYVLVS